MHIIPATEAKNRFGELLETANREPVEIAKSGRTVAVVLSAKTYRDMERRIRESETPTRFSGLAAWRKSAKKRKTPKPMDEVDYQKHLTEKYGR
jgi:prevent-host-death family protein